MLESNTEQRLAVRLAELRLQRGWSLDDLSVAVATGISRASLSRIERSETSPTAALLNRLCVAYGLTMSRLLSEEEENLLIAYEQPPVWQDNPSGFQRCNVSPPATHFRRELVEGKLRSGARIDYDAPPIHGLEQHIWLSEGGFTVTMGAQQRTLQPGGCLRFHLVGKSAFEAHLTDGARYLLAVAKP